MSKYDTIQLADNAQKIINNPAWEQITTHMLDGMRESWAECNDPVVREQIWATHNALTELIGEFQSAILSGEIATQNPEED